MQQLIDDLLTLSSLETDSPPPLEDPIDAAALLADIRQEVTALSAGRHRITLENQGPRGLLGSARELRSAFANLAGNAVRYTPHGGEIVLRWSTEGTGGGRFSVRDSGIGIAPQHLPRLTERFYRVDRGRSRDAGGTGLGLAIVKHVLERHQAVLQVESEAGAGFSLQRGVSAAPGSVVKIAAFEFRAAIKDAEQLDASASSDRP